MPFIPTDTLHARLCPEIIEQGANLRAHPPLVIPHAPHVSGGRRAFIRSASGLLLGAGLTHLTSSAEASQLIFSPEDEKKRESAMPAVSSEDTPSRLGKVLGVIPPDFWYRPRELWLRRTIKGQNREIRAVYWKDGALQSEGYWQVCAMLQDVRKGVMTAIDPGIMDILRGVQGYYEAWRWPHPIVINSGFRTLETNNALAAEGAAKNSMHLYGKAVDMRIPGIPVKDIAALGAYLKQGGVGFYPSKGFIHLDTGRLRTWQGR